MGILPSVAQGPGNRYCLWTFTVRAPFVIVEHTNTPVFGISYCVPEPQSPQHLKFWGVAIVGTLGPISANTFVTWRPKVTIVVTRCYRLLVVCRFLLSPHLMSYLTGSRSEVSRGTLEQETIHSYGAWEGQIGIPSVTWARPVR